MQQYQGVKVFS